MKIDRKLEKGFGRANNSVLNEGKDDMDHDWEREMANLSNLQVSSNPNNQPVTITGSADDLKCIGVGTDAAVFQSINRKEYVYKKYAPDKIDKVKVESDVYRRLGDSAFFPTCYGYVGDTLILSYEEGRTLFDCVLQGIHIPRQVVDDVEEAREYIRMKGLNPRDIHLKNILLQHGRAKILDVSEYIHPGNDFRWEHLKDGYERFYHLIDGKAVPFWIAETVRKWYHHRNKHFSSYEEFLNFVVGFLHKR